MTIIDNSCLLCTNAYICTHSKTESLRKITFSRFLPISHISPGLLNSTLSYQLCMLICDLTCYKLLVLSVNLCQNSFQHISAKCAGHLHHHHVYSSSLQYFFFFLTFWWCSLFLAIIFDMRANVCFVHSFEVSTLSGQSCSKQN